MNLSRNYCRKCKGEELHHLGRCVHCKTVLDSVEHPKAFVRGWPIPIHAPRPNKIPKRCPW